MVALRVLRGIHPYDGGRWGGWWHRCGRWGRRSRAQGEGRGCRSWCSATAAFWVAAALVVPGSQVRIKGVGLNPTRSGFLDILRRMGAYVEASGVREGWIGEPVGELVVRHSKLRGTGIVAGDVPGAVDELPLLALVGA